MINGSFVFGLDGDGSDVFERTVNWGIKNAITTATYHLLTPYPGTKLFEQMKNENRITSYNWDLYDTRHIVYKPKLLSASELEGGYEWAYKEFYKWANILKAANFHENIVQKTKHFAYTGGWKKMEPLWKIVINSGALKLMLPFLELLLSEVKQPLNKSVNNKSMYNKDKIGA